MAYPFTERGLCARAARARPARAPRRLLVALVVALGAGGTSAAFAALGGDVDSVLRDHQAIGTTPTVLATNDYDLYESETSDGLRLREYVDRTTGKVFALSFRGPRAPGIAGLLGSYASRYLAAAKARRPQHHVVVVNDPDLSIAVMRLPRGWSGSAQLTAAIPASVDRTALR